jgi:hypothetical protein
VGQLRKVKPTIKKVDPKAKARERRVIIQEIVEGGQTFNEMENIDNDVKSLKQKLDVLTTSKPGRLIRGELEKQSITALIKCQQDYANSNNQDVRNTAVSGGMFQEFRNIQKKVVSLQEIADTTRSTVKLIYDMEFGNQRGGHLARRTFSKVINKVITKKAGGDASNTDDDDETQRPIFKKKGGDEMKERHRGQTLRCTPLALVSESAITDPVIRE